MSSSDSNGNDSNNSIKNTEKDQNKTSIIEVLDELISHMNTTRNVFKVMILSSFILAPLSLILAGVFVIHPFFMHRILFRIPELGIFLLLFIGVSIMLASMWLFIGLSEQRFFSNWDKKYNRYASLKNQLDKELGE
jgi:MFS superfamily sulfate permease-like transporter